MSDQVAKQVIAFIFKRNGKKEMIESEFYLTLSMELQWCPPNIAKSFLNECKKTSFIQLKNDLIIPNFNIEKTVIPIDFQPSTDFFNDYKIKETDEGFFNPDHFFDLLKLFLKNSSEEVNDEIKFFMKNKNVNRNIAMLLIAKKHGMELKNYASLLVKDFFKENTI